MAAPSIVQHAETITPSTSATSVSVTLGSAPTDGNLLVAVLMGGNGGETVSPPSGWTQRHRAGSAGSYDLRYVATKTAASEGTTFTFTLSGSGDTYALVVFEISGADDLDTANLWSSLANGVDSWKFGPTTPAVDDSLMIAIGGYWQADAFDSTFSNGYAEQFDIDETGGWDMTFYGASKALATAAATETTVTIQGSHNAFGVLFPIKPATGTDYTDSGTAQADLSTSGSGVMSIGESGSGSTDFTSDGSGIMLATDQQTAEVAFSGIGNSSLVSDTTDVVVIDLGVTGGALSGFTDRGSSEVAVSGSGRGVVAAGEEGSGIVTLADSSIDIQHHRTSQYAEVVLSNAGLDTFTATSGGTVQAELYATGSDVVTNPGASTSTRKLRVRWDSRRRQRSRTREFR